MNSVGFAAGQRHSPVRGLKRTRRESDTESNVETVHSHYQIKVNHAGRLHVKGTCMLKAWDRLSGRGLLLSRVVGFATTASIVIDRGRKARVQNSLAGGFERTPRVPGIEN